MISATVALPSGSIERWHAELIEWVRSAEHVSLQKVVIGAPQQHEPPINGRTVGRVLRAYEMIDRRIFRLPDDPLTLVDLGETHVRLNEQHSDVVLDLTDSETHKPSPRHVWKLRVGMAGSSSRDWLWHEVLSGVETFEVALEARTAGDLTPHKVSSSVCRVDRVSLHRTRCFAAWRGLELVQSALNEFATQGALPAPATPSAPGAVPGQRRRASAASLLRLPGRLIARKLDGRVVRDQWWIQWRKATREPPWTALGRTGKSWARLNPPADRFYADPFLLEREGRMYMFYEEFRYRTRRGTIALTVINEEGTVGQPRTILSGPHHLSYPFVFQEEGETYMVPECAESGSVVIYRAQSFPDDWVPMTTIVSGMAAADPTLAKIDGRFWLWVAVPDRAGFNFDNALLFHAESLFGPWIPHALNPVVSDVTRARPAGRLFRWKGSLIRPSQDAGGRYGRQLKFNEVEVLTPSAYEESELSSSPPIQRNAVGMHTYERVGGLEAIDLARRRLARAPWRGGQPGDPGVLARQRTATTR